MLTLEGENYFGENNCECLCRTCEDRCHNGWTPNEAVEPVPKLSIEIPSKGYSFRRTERRLGSSPLSRDQSETPDINIRPKVSKRTPRLLSRFKSAEGSPLGKSPSVEPSVTPLKRKRELELLSPSPAPKKAKKKTPIVKQEEIDVALPTTEAAVDNPSPTMSRFESEALSPASSSNNEATVTDATSVDEDTIIVRPLINPVISKLRRGDKIPDPLEQAKAGATILVGQSTSTAHPVLQDDTLSVLSELPSELELDESNMTITVKPVSKKRKREMQADVDNSSKSTTPKPSAKKRARKLPPPKTDIDHAPPVRHPGDYVLTTALLAEPASSWIVCKICKEAFVQKDAYFTRSSCPRCERHSKLYGYMWPKTDKVGRDDEEERVLDHRTIHRFVPPEEERASRMRRRGSTGSN
jgi:histone-lysine N-methyltransferase SUV420H